MGTDFERNAIAGLLHFRDSAFVKWDDIVEGMTVSKMTALEDIGQDLIDAGWLFREVIEEISDTTHTVTLTYTRASLDENADVRPVVVTDESGSMARLKAVREMRRRTFGPGKENDGE